MSPFHFGADYAGFPDGDFEVDRMAITSLLILKVKGYKPDIITFLTGIRVYYQ